MLLDNGTKYHIHHGDCIPHMAEMPAVSVDFSVFSPPFPSLYAYTSSEADIGNSEDLKGEAKIHLSFFYRQLARIVKPGRAIVVHVAQIPRMKRAGGVGLFDFRGMNIRLAERAGLIFEYDWVVRKNPQSQAIRTRSRELQFAGLESDRAKSRGALPDYLLKFRAPGDNEVPVDSDGDVSRNEWIDWAECCWGDIRETDTLNVTEGKGENDTKHICALQLAVVDRLVRLYTNPGEIVFTPFAGIGTELYCALKRGRRAYGCELKDEYYQTALRNCERAIKLVESSEAELLFAPKPVATAAALVAANAPQRAFDLTGTRDDMPEEIVPVKNVNGKPAGKPAKRK
jgi:DNA modification methylase